MSQNENQPTARQQLIAALSQIVGLPLTAVRRAADMRTFQFGSLRPIGRGSVGDFALHVQCPWRIEGPEGIVTGRLDLWEPVKDNALFDEHWDYEQSPNLQDARLERWLADYEGARSSKVWTPTISGARRFVSVKVSCFGCFLRGRGARTGDCFGRRPVPRIWSSVAARWNATWERDITGEEKGRREGTRNRCSPKREEKVPDTFSVPRNWIPGRRAAELHR
jgi:hypothetical protein